MRFTEGGGDEGLGVPYPQGDNPEGFNVGDFDLKKEPARISEIHEVRGWPEMEEFLKAVNKSDSLFRTLRCDVFGDDYSHKKMKKRVISYVTIAFKILDWNGPKGTYGDLYQRFQRFASQYHTPDTIYIKFHLIPTSYNYPGGGRGWSVDIYTVGYGATERDARSAWQSGLKRVREFLAWRSARYGGELRKGRRTIGAISEQGGT
jgi:hypothetical protein